ncbi:MAG: sugar ABC transporter ATP-binding protein, partial [Thermoprotei archaeon]
MAKVTLNHVTKIFPPNTVAVDDVTFTVSHGEFFVLLGPSGCGKTTTLRIIAGLEKPTKGRVFIDDEDVTDLPPRARDVAMVFQTWALYPHMKVYDNIAFPLKLRKLPKDEIDRKVKEIAKILQIDHLLDRYPKQLSGGQQQRVALARALVRNPRVWLMDEPLSNLDALLRVQMRAELKKLQKELKITTIYVTHDQVEAMTMADRIAVMNAGKILQIGTPYDIYHKPRTKFVGGFIGSPPMNFIRVVFDVENNRYILKGHTFAIVLPEG